MARGREISCKMYLSKVFFIALSMLILSLVFVNAEINSNETLLGSNLILNITIDNPGLTELIFNWNGTNYTLYGDSLFLLAGFDNISVLGENSTNFADVSEYANNGTINQYGTSQTMTDDLIKSIPGTWETLSHSKIYPGTENVTNYYKNQTYKIGDDYEINYTSGKIKPLANGSMEGTGWVYNQIFNTTKLGRVIDITVPHLGFWGNAKANVTNPEGNVTYKLTSNCMVGGDYILGSTTGQLKTCPTGNMQNYTSYNISYRYYTTYYVSYQYDDMGADYDSGIYDLGLSFDGSDDYLIINDSDKNSPKDEVSVEGWFMLDDISNNAGMVWKVSYNYALFRAGNTIYFMAWNESVNHSRAVFHTSYLKSGWNHIIGIFNGTNSILYLNGEQKGQIGSTMMGGIRDSPGDLWIGKRQQGWKTDMNAIFAGSMDSIRIYNRTLTEDEIMLHYQTNLKKYDVDKWNLFINKTNLTEGAYTYYVYMKDSDGNVNQTEVRNIIIDITPSNLSFIDDVDAGAVISDVIDVDYSDAIVKKYKFVDDAGDCNGNNASDYTGVINLSDESENGKYFCAYGQDDSENNATLVSGNKINVDINSPSIEFTFPTPASGNYNSSQIINVSAIDANLDSIVIYVNDTAIRTCQADVCDFVLNDGNYSVYSVANDSLGNANQTDNLSIVVDSSLPTLVSNNITGGYNDAIFSPANSDGVYDDLDLDAEANEIVNWSTIKVYDSDGNQVKYWTKVDENTIISKSWTPINVGLADGIYNINTTITDMSGNSVDVELGSFEIDNTAPQISGEVKSPEAVYSGDDVIFFANVSENYLDSVLLYGNWTGAMTGYAVTEHSGNAYNYTVNGSEFQRGEDVYWYFLANDSVGNEGNTSMNNFVVENRVPNITTTPVETAVEEQLYEYDVNASDGDSDDLTYSLTMAPAGMEINLSSGEINWTPGNSDVGLHNISILVEDSYGGNDTQGFVLSVNNTNDAPVIEINYPNGGEILAGINTISWNASDIDGDDLIITIYYGDGGSWNLINETENDGSYEWDTTNVLDAASYLINITANDSSDVTEDISDAVFSVDNTLPEIEIVYPQNLIYNANITELNYTYTEDNPDECWYNLDNGENNTITCGDNVTGMDIGDGSHTLIIYINDTAGNENYSAVTFSVDTIAPEIQIIIPIDTIYNNATQIVNISAPESESIWFNWNGSNESYIAPAEITFDEGNNTLTAWANDSAGNVNETNVTFSIDTTNPSITDNSGLSPGYYNESKIIDIAFADNNLINASLYVNGVITNQSEFTGNETSLSYDLADGNYSYYADVVDIAGNGNGTATINSVIIDLSNPEIAFENPSPDEGENISGIQIINVSAIDANLDSIVIYIDGVEKKTCTEANCIYDWNTSLESDGSYTINAAAADFAGHINLTETRAINVDNSAPLVSFESPTPGSGSYNSSQIINVSAIDANLDSIVIYVNDTAIRTCQADVCDFVLNDGNYSVYSVANDSLGNTNQTDTRQIFIDSIAPDVSIDSINPNPAEYGINNVVINWTASDANLNLSSSSYYAHIEGPEGALGDFPGSTGGLTLTPLVLTKGNYTITIYASDYAENQNNTSADFSVQDNAAPGITNSNISSPNEYGEDVTIRVDVIDYTGIDKVIANVSEILYNMSLESGNTYKVIIPNPDVGNYNIEYLANDTLGNLNDSITDSFVVDDSIAPVWNPVPENQTIEINEAFYYDVNATDLQDITYSINDNVNFAIDSATGEITNNTALNSGDYNLEINASDVSGNTNTSNIIITMAPPYSTFVNSWVDGVKYNGDYNNVAGIYNSSLDISSVNNSDVKYSTLYNSTIIDSSVDTCTISDSWFEGGYCKDATIDPSSIINSNTTGSIITDSHIWNSNATNSNVTDSNIDNSSVDNSNLSENSNINNATVTDSDLTDSIIGNGSIVTNTSLANANVSNTTMTNTIIQNSTIMNTAVSDATITDNQILSGTIQLENGSIYNASESGTLNLSDAINYPPAASIAIADSSGFTESEEIIFVSNSTDENIPGELNDSLTYLWNFGDGSNSTETSPKHAYSEGTYNVTLSVTDSFNGTDSTMITIIINASLPATSSGSSGGSSDYLGAFWMSVYTVDAKQFEEGYVKAIAVRERLKVDISNDTHFVGIMSITNNSAVIEVASTPQQATLAINQEKKFDVTDDGYYDILIRLNNITNSKSELFIQKINEGIPVADCIPNWNCTEWGSCENGSRTKTCNDINNCRNETNKPEEKQDCSSSSNILGAVIGAFKNPKYGRIYIFLVVLIICFIVFKLFTRKKRTGKIKVIKARKNNGDNGENN